jgi:hypothetical protein
LISAILSDRLLVVASVSARRPSAAAAGHRRPGRKNVVPGRSGRTNSTAARERARLHAWIAAVSLLIGLPWLSSGCATFAPAPSPAQPENICGIFAERLTWYRDTQAAALRWGVPVSLQLAVIYQESSFRARARPPRLRLWSVLPGRRLSSAYGYGQIIDSTWSEYQRSAGGPGASRDDFRDVADFIGWYADRVQARLGIVKDDAFQFYLVYHEGLVGFQRASYRAKPLIEQAARQVEARSGRYAAQLEVCREDLESRLTRPWWWPF